MEEAFDYSRPALPNAVPETSCRSGHIFSRDQPGFKRNSIIAVHSLAGEEVVLILI